MTDFQKLINCIVPIPQQAKMLQGESVCYDSDFQITAPEAPFGPVHTAKEKIHKLCDGKTGEKVTVTLQVEPGEMDNREGYRLTVEKGNITITGFGESGLLYGVITLEQLFAKNASLPAMEIIDWPKNPIRGFKEECRYGSNLMTEEEWMEMLEDMASKKMNTLGLALYGCWTIQYDGKVSQSLYMPVDGHPELNTPVIVKYYSPKEQRWVEEEQLPPIFCGDLLDKIFSKARDLGIKVIPYWNSLGHNTLLPAKCPEVAPINEEGVRQKYGFCTSNDATYELLFSIFDQLIEKYMKPYGMDTMSLLLDEVHEGIGRDEDDVFAMQDPWCHCEKCSRLEKGEIFIRHAVKMISYLKSKGLKGAIICCDMLQEGRRSKLGWLGDRLLEACRQADVLDILMVDWWSYHDIDSKNWIKTLYPEKGFRSMVAPWNGYHTWSITLQPLRNAEILSKINERDGGEGILAYAMWDRACDRTHDNIAEFSWNPENVGDTLSVTERYVSRHFPGREEEAYRAYRLMDSAMEQRHTTKWSFPDREDISYMDLMTYRLSPYNYSYVKANAPYPRAFLDEALSWVLTMRPEVEQALQKIVTEAKEAKEIFISLAQDPACDKDMANRQICECENYQVLAEDWLTILQMQDLCQKKEYNLVRQLAKERENARLHLLTNWEQYKERSIAQAMGLRQQCIFLQMFADIAGYEEQPEENWDLMDIRKILSQRSFWLR